MRILKERGLFILNPLDPGVGTGEHVGAAVVQEALQQGIRGGALPEKFVGATRRAMAAASARRRCGGASAALVIWLRGASVCRVPGA